MNEPLSTSDGTETLDRHAHGSRASSDVPAGSLWASAIATSETPSRPTAARDSGDEKITDPEVETITRRVATTASPTALLELEESGRLRARWSEIQGQFVDEPRSAVQQADSLVSEVIEQITRVFASERSSLESQWKRGGEVSTEDLRKALQQYRSFFNRLVV
jgi:hypothetical protein